jgi:hypothetical protein
VTIHIAEGTDPATLLPALAESYSSDTRFQVRDVDSDYRSAIQLSGEYAEGYVIGTTGGEHALVVDSFSPCFELPPTMSPFDDFEHAWRRVLRRSSPTWLGQPHLAPG